MRQGQRGLHLMKEIGKQSRRTMQKTKESCSTLLETNITPSKSLLKMFFLFPRWDMLVPRSVYLILFVICPSFLDINHVHFISPRTDVQTARTTRYLALSRAPSLQWPPTSAWSRKPANNWRTQDWDTKLRISLAPFSLEMRGFSAL